MVVKATHKNAPQGSLTAQQLAQLVDRGLTVRQIADRLDRSPSTVRHWLGRFGLTTQPPKGASATVAHCPTHGETAFFTSGRRSGCARGRAEHVSAWRRRTKRILVDEAGGACVLCGYDRSAGTLHFHHLDPSTKRFGVSGRGLTRAIADLRIEAAKCALLCANCHSDVELGVAKLPAAPPDRG